MSSVGFVVKHQFKEPCVGHNCGSGAVFTTSLSDSTTEDVFLKGSVTEQSISRSVGHTGDKVCVFADRYITTKFGTLFSFVGFGDLNVLESGVITLEDVAGSKIAQTDAWAQIGEFDKIISQLQTSFPSSGIAKASAYYTKDEKEYVVFGFNFSFEKAFKLIVTKPDGTKVEIVRDEAPEEIVQYQVSRVYSNGANADGSASMGIDRLNFKGHDAETLAKAQYNDWLKMMAPDGDGQGTVCFGVYMIGGAHLHHQPGDKCLIAVINQTETGNDNYWLSSPPKTESFDAVKSKLISDITTELKKEPNSYFEIDSSYSVEDITTKSTMKIALGGILGISFLDDTLL